MHTFIWGPARLQLILKIWLTVAGERWKEFQFPSPNGKLAKKSPFSPTLSHTKNENQPFGALIKRKIDGLLSSQDTGRLKTIRYIMC